MCVRQWEWEPQSGAEGKGRLHRVQGCTCCDLCVRREDSRSSRGSISSQDLLRCGEGRVSSHQLPLSGALHCAINAFPGWASLGGEGSGPVPKYHGWMTSATLWFNCCIISDYSCMLCCQSSHPTLYLPLAPPADMLLACRPARITSASCYTSFPSKEKLLTDCPAGMQLL